jgi:hypothetical protein
MIKRSIKQVNSKTTNRPSILDEQVHMLQTYDPGNLMLNPSLIKFLSSRKRNRHKQRLKNIYDDQRSQICCN